MPSDPLKGLEELGVEDVVKLTLPLKSRYPNRLLRRIRFAKGGSGYWIVLCKGLSCRACGFPEEPTVTIEHVVERDVLSDLRHRVPVVTLRCCGEVVGRGVWDGSRIVLEDIACWVEFGAGGVVCRGRVCGDGLVECVRECLGV